MDDVFEVKDKYGLYDLVALTKLLRDPVRGCPWDKQQTHASIRQNFIEETYEAVDAIDRGSAEDLREELGDVLLQVSLHCEMEREAGHFDIDDVVTELCQKLVLRHPHIFGDVTAKDSRTVLSNWEAIKRVEKSQSSGVEAIEAVPKALPSLMRSQKVQKRAGYVGFDYDGVSGALDALESELCELRRAVDGDGDVEEELGDLLFAAVNVARFQKLDAERACEKACEKFAGRFAVVERLAAQRGVDLKTAGLEALDALWDEAKKVYSAGNCKLMEDIQ
ncbi:MAG: nucleoside triphosphate pyrophosphohydrolase [Oscillospiraceae bacterium]|nr:nucleoside triphosphate pyrophosphohydrolase [Oscillospiraceae bacterium]